MRLKSKEYVSKVIGTESRQARLQCLSYTLKEMSDTTGINLKTLSGFEHGRSSNLYIFYVYYSLLSIDDRLILLNKILERIE